jgi:hypothetical protein
VALKSDTLALLDYRRRVAHLYQTVRVSVPGEDAWHVWRSGRDELFATHTESALEEEDIRRLEECATSTTTQRGDSFSRWNRSTQVNLLPCTAGPGVRLCRGSARSRYL